MAKESLTFWQRLWKALINIGQFIIKVVVLFFKKVKEPNEQKHFWGSMFLLYLFGSINYLTDGYIK